MQERKLKEMEGAMPRGGQLSRQWRLIQLIDRPQGITVDDAARDLSVTIRTVWRDLDVLQKAGFPLYTERALTAIVAIDDQVGTSRTWEANDPAVQTARRLYVTAVVRAGASTSAVSASACCAPISSAAPSADFVMTNCSKPLTFFRTVTLVGSR